MQLSSFMQQVGAQARAAGRTLATLAADHKNQALLAMAAALQAAEAEVMAANANDVAAAKAAGKDAAYIDRLTLNPERFAGMVNSIKTIAEFVDPVGRELAAWTQPNGLQIRRVSTPLGVIGVIYESRPNVTADAAALCFKAGNAVILRGGSDCVASNTAIATALQAGLRSVEMDDKAIQLITDPSRERVSELLQMHQYIDVIVPRGGKGLIEKISRESQIPLFKHLDGICHTYVHGDADPDMAVHVVVNAKCRRPGICGATETLLLDAALAQSTQRALLEALADAGCELRGDEAMQILSASVQPATAADWDTEYLAPIISIKVVDGVVGAIAHIQAHSSSHTEAIICTDLQVRDEFFQHIDSAIVMHNCSTQFADGGEFGLGAEIGIATGRLHARGPVGVEQLTTFHYQVCGQGQTRPL